MLADAPLAYWRLGEVTGTTVADERGAHAGQYSGGVTLGRAGGLRFDSNPAAGFDGITGNASISNATDLQLSTNFTLEAWLYPTRFTQSGGGGYPRILQKGRGDSGTAGAGYALMTNASNGHLRTDLEGLHPAGAESTSSIPLNQWTHAVVTYDGAFVRYYLNGKLDASVATSGRIPANADPLLLANRSDQPRFWRGQLDEVAMYPSVLSPAQVQSHYAVGTTVASTQPPLPVATTVPSTLTPLPVATTVPSTLTPLPVATTVPSTPTPLPTATSLPSTQPAVATATTAGTVYWQSDFESGNFSDWLVMQDGTNNAGANGNTVVSIIDSPTRAGKHAASLVDNANTGTPHDAANLVLD
ncbi:MAG: hypothetical protein LC797_12095, partial [Chloroflexi bacterium]|nr:hypothetical protein [Chloroflexota bacterium]